MANHVQRATGVHLLTEPRQQHIASLCSMILGQRIPRLRISFLYPGQHVCREQSQSAVLVGVVAFGINPAMVSDELTYFGLEADFPVQVHTNLSLHLFVAATLM